MPNIDTLTSHSLCIHIEQYILLLLATNRTEDFPFPFERRTMNSRNLDSCFWHIILRLIVSGKYGIFTSSFKRHVTTMNIFKLRS